MDNFIRRFLVWADWYLNNSRVSIQTISASGLTLREYIQWFLEGFNELNIRLLESTIMIHQYIERVREFIIRYLNSDSVLDEWFLSLENAYHRFIVTQRIFFEITYPSMRRLTNLLRRSDNVEWVIRNLYRISNYRSRLIRSTVADIRVHLENLRRIMEDIFRS
jgi:hypothetical protein